MSSRNSNVTVDVSPSKSHPGMYRVKPRTGNRTSFLLGEREVSKWFDEHNQRLVGTMSKSTGDVEKAVVRKSKSHPGMYRVKTNGDKKSFLIRVTDVQRREVRAALQDLCKKNGSLEFLATGWHDKTKEVRLLVRGYNGIERKRRLHHFRGALGAALAFECCHYSR
jgi:hypothetical protein